MGGQYILDAAGNPQSCEDPLEWGQWMASAERHVAQDEDEGAEPGTAIRISTVFLGLDHQFGHGPPVLWETMVFGGVLDGECDRYTSKEAALLGHQAMCQRVRETMPPQSALVKPGN